MHHAPCIIPHVKQALHGRDAFSLSKASHGTAHSIDFSSFFRALYACRPADLAQLAEHIPADSAPDGYSGSDLSARRGSPLAGQLHLVTAPRHAALAAPCVYCNTLLRSRLKGHVKSYQLHRIGSQQGLCLRVLEAQGRSASTYTASSSVIVRCCCQYGRCQAAVTTVVSACVFCLTQLWFVSQDLAVMERSVLVSQLQIHSFPSIATLHSMRGCRRLRYKLLSVARHLHMLAALLRYLPRTCMS